MVATTETSWTLHATDVSNQRSVRVVGVKPSRSVAEVLEQVRSQLQLPQQDVHGRPMLYQARLEREGRHLHASERVADAMQNEDRIVVVPNVDAG